MSKVNVIERDRIKQGCSCEYLAPSESRSGKKYLTKQCKACMHKKGLSIGRFNLDEQIRKQEFYKKRIESFSEFVEEFYVENKEVPEVHKNWIQRFLKT